MSSIQWKPAIEFEDITYKKCKGVARIAFNRPDVRNAFRPQTTSELLKAFHDANEDTSIGVVLLSAEGPSSKDGVFSFCSGGDQKARGDEGYIGKDGYHRLNILEVQRLIRFMPKAVIAVVPGWAVGGGRGHQCRRGREVFGGGGNDPKCSIGRQQQHLSGIGAEHSDRWHVELDDRILECVPYERGGDRNDRRHHREGAGDCQWQHRFEG